jgi:hypothetical protein
MYLLLVNLINKITNKRDVFSILIHLRTNIVRDVIVLMYLGTKEMVGCPIYFIYSTHMRQVFYYAQVYFYR